MQDGMLFCDGFGISRISNQLQAIPQPLNRGSSDKDTPLETIGDLTGQPIGYRCQQFVP